MQKLPDIVTKTFSPDQIEAIDQLYFSGKVSPRDRLYCFCVAATLNLNPILGEIMFLGRRQKVAGKWVDKTEAMVGRDGYLAIAHRSNQFDGLEVSSDVRKMPLFKEGVWGTADMLTATCKVWRKGFSRPFVVEVTYNEYVQTDRDGNPTTFWLEKADLMLRKVAESQALRKAFDIHGTYSPEELGIGTVNAAGKLEYDRHSQASPVTVQLICQSEIDEIDEMISKTKTDKTRMLEYFGVASITELPVESFKRAVDILRKKLVKVAENRQQPVVVPAILETLANRHIPAKVEANGDIIATPKYGDSTAVTILRGFGFVQRSNGWLKSAKQQARG